MEGHRFAFRRFRLALLVGGGLLVTAIWQLAVQVRYASITEADVMAMRPVHYFTSDRKHHPAQFEWSFTQSEFVLRNELGAIPSDLVGKLLPAGATADEIRGKWKLAQGEGEAAMRLVLTEIKAGDREGRKEVRLRIFRTAPGVIRVGEPQYVFARDLKKTAEADDAGPGKTRFELRSGPIQPGLTLTEGQPPVHWATLTAEIDAKGEGRGTLVLDSTPPEFDEFGDPLTGAEIELPETKRESVPPMEFKCLLQHVKLGGVERVNEASIVWVLYRLKIPKIKSALFLATAIEPGQTRGRLLVHGPDNRVHRVIDLRDTRPPELLLPPCHPGCFPAGTRVLVPGGVARIEQIRAGDTVTTIGPDGQARSSAVSQVFTTRNRIVELRSERGTLATTRTQPVCLAGGGFRTVEKLKSGDRIWQWREGGRREVVVQEITPTAREEPVFNLIVGNSAIFVAGDFLVRGKPPAEGNPPVGRADLQSALREGVQ